MYENKLCLFYFRTKIILQAVNCKQKWNFDRENSKQMKILFQRSTGISCPDNTPIVTQRQSTEKGEKKWKKRKERGGKRGGGGDWIEKK